MSMLCAKGTGFQWVRVFIESNYSEILNSSSQANIGKNKSIKQIEVMKSLDKPIDEQEPITLVERRAFLILPIEQRRRIMAKQAKEMEDHYRYEKIEDLETGEIIEY